MKCCNCGKNPSKPGWYLCEDCWKIVRERPRAFEKQPASQPTPNIRGDNRPGMAAKAAVAK